jgi:prephenate dehydratase
MPKIAYLGPEGTFGWKVATSNNPGAELIPCSSHAQVIHAVVEGRANRGYVARENSLGGTVTDTVDPLGRNAVGTEMRFEQGEVISSHGGVVVCGEVVLPIVQCLYGVPQRVARVYSHPQAITQCEEFIRARFPGAELIHARSTIAGVEELRQDKEAVAIAPPWAVDFYPDIPLVETGIQDSPVNDTRFLVIGTNECAPTGQDKTSLWFTVPEDEKPGSFDRVSMMLALCGVNKRLIESRPMRTLLGRYVFLIDVDGHRLDPVLSRVLELLVLTGLTTSLRIWGSYPRQNGRNA